MTPLASCTLTHSELFHGDVAMTRRRLVGFVLCLMLAAAAHGAADATGPTFYEDVLPILQENCQECHRPSGGKIYRGGVPMSLTTYDEARPWARAIVRMTGSKEMPPWDASEHFDGVFRNERGLTDAEIATLKRWVEAGAQPGRPENGPAPIDWADDEGWIFTDPDMVLEMPAPYFVEDAGASTPIAPWCSEASRPTRC